ncbi:helix-turn-helix transcriptional regulator [bacterium]|nr:helix-turn-helix transcriptional regulator [bacterium]
MANFKLDRKSIGRRIRSIRILKNWTQKELADIIGIRPDSIRSYEAGRSVPKLDSLLLLSQTFSVSMEWLVTGKGELEFSTSTDASRHTGDISEAEIEPISNQ